jgi:hypothetical protein
VDDEKSYFYIRAEAELEMAQRSDHPAVVKAHYTMAGHYLDKVYGNEIVKEKPRQT